MKTELATQQAATAGVRVLDDHPEGGVTLMVSAEAVGEFLPGKRREMGMRGTTLPRLFEESPCAQG